MEPRYVLNWSDMDLRNALLHHLGQDEEDQGNMTLLAGNVTYQNHHGVEQGPGNGPNGDNMAFTQIHPQPEQHPPSATALGATAELPKQQNAKVWASPKVTPLEEVRDISLGIEQGLWSLNQQYFQTQSLTNAAYGEASKSAGKIDGIVDKVDGIVDKVDGIANGMDQIAHSLWELKNENKELKKEIAELKQETATIKQNVMITGDFSVGGVAAKLGDAMVEKIALHLTETLVSHLGAMLKEDNDALKKLVDSCTANDSEASSNTMLNGSV